MGNVVVLGQSGAIPEGAFAELTLNQQWIVSWRGALCGAFKFDGDSTRGHEVGAQASRRTTGSWLATPSRRNGNLMPTKSERHATVAGDTISQARHLL